MKNKISLSKNQRKKMSFKEYIKFRDKNYFNNNWYNPDCDFSTNTYREGLQTEGLWAIKAIAIISFINQRKTGRPFDLKDYFKSNDISFFEAQAWDALIKQELINLEYLTDQELTLVEKNINKKYNFKSFKKGWIGINFGKYRNYTVLTPIRAYSIKSWKRFWNNYRKKHPYFILGDMINWDVEKYKKIIKLQEEISYITPYGIAESIFEEGNISHFHITDFLETWGGCFAYDMSINEIKAWKSLIKKI